MIHNGQMEKAYKEAENIFKNRLDEYSENLKAAGINIPPEILNTYSLEPNAFERSMRLLGIEEDKNGEIMTDKNIKAACYVIAKQEMDEQTRRSSPSERIRSNIMPAIKEGKENALYFINKGINENEERTSYVDDAYDLSEQNNEIIDKLDSAKNELLKAQKIISKYENALDEYNEIDREINNSLKLIDEAKEAIEKENEQLFENEKYEPEESFNLDELKTSVKEIGTGVISTSIEDSRDSR